MSESAPGAPLRPLCVWKSWVVMVPGQEGAQRGCSMCLRSLRANVVERRVPATQVLHLRAVR